MRCPFCGHVDSKVLDSRANNNARSVRRRRECLSCGRRFTTKEYVEESPLYVIKSDGSREVFNRDKVLKGVQLACNKRPISSDEIENLVDRVENCLRDKNNSEIEAMQIGLEVMNELRELDEVAYVRFASVYRKFQDKEEFISELRGLQQKGH
ncbi:MAG: transcriptional repressor NrdR [Deferribacteres bacterium]|nr:transcriptional repressor NrdR [candidate division KSB1 bacterium]MCB9511348.1 transcriptional repressor NrdR [Deferribacteres bacterium]